MSATVMSSYTGKALSCKPRTCHGKKGVVGFSSWFLENCFLPQNDLVRKLSLFHKKGFFSLFCSAYLYSYLALITFWLSFLKLNFLKLASCAHEMYLCFSTTATSPPPHLFNLSTNNVPSIELPLKISWLLHSYDHVSLSLWDTSWLPIALEGKQNHRIKRLS